MSQQELVKRVVRVLEASGAGYMLTGSIVSSLMGEPRLTHDIDIVVELNESSIPFLLEAFPEPDFYIEEASIREAIANGTMFNLIDMMGDKVDFWMLTERPFDRSRFSRKIRMNILGQTVFVTAPEDLILMKLYWSKLSGGSEKQHKDALRVYEVQREQLDGKYLTLWADILDVSDLLRRLITEAEEI